MIRNRFRPIIFAAALSGVSVGGAWAQDKMPIPGSSPNADLGGEQATLCGLQVEDAWVRATVPGQKGTGAFMRLTAGQACQIVAAQSPIAGVAQVHRMDMEGNVMHMRPVQGGLPLPAGQTVTLTPGGLHVMLMDLRQPVVEGASVPITLTLQDQKNGARGQVTVNATVRALGAGGMSHSMHDMPSMTH